MKLVLKRINNQDNYCEGKLYINGIYQCDVIEDTDRDLNNEMSIAEIQSKKVYGETAIPKGTYQITLDVVSPKFKNRSWATFCEGKLPRLLDVPGFEGVLIHVGNKAADSLGCLLIGQKSSDGIVSNSTQTFKDLYYKLKQATDQITITIE